jgi:uncharacterized membrane protein YagU involved in acid resistance
MSETVFGSSGDRASFARPRAVDTILYGGLVVGVLDMLFAFTFYGLILGAPPLRIFQSVAAGVLGRTAASEGGVRTFLLGILLHFVVATCIAAVYYLATLILPMLIRHAVVSGLVYGMIAYLGMKYVVVPLSAIGQRGRLPRLPIFLTEIIGHALLVGLPLALLARRSAKKNGHDFRHSASAETSLNPSDI